MNANFFMGLQITNGTNLQVATNSEWIDGKSTLWLSAKKLHVLSG